MKAAGSILVVDDDYNILEILNGWLEKLHEVYLAVSVEAGLKMLSSYDIGLVFLDYVLPDAHGLDTLKRIKRQYPSVPVIFITGHGNEGVCQEAFRAGATDYIKKPFDKKEILSKAVLLMSIDGDRKSYRNILNEEISDFVGFSISRDVKDSFLLNISEVKKYIDANIDKQISLAEASKMAAMNITYFCRYFQQLTGHSLTSYITNKRIQEAKELLRNSNLSLQNISAMLGFNSVNYFTEIFKRYTGFSPAKFRKGRALENRSP